MTRHIGEGLHLKRVWDESGEQDFWLLFEQGVAHPLIVLTDFQVTKFIETVELERRNKPETQDCPF